MALYLGSDKLKINSCGVAYCSRFTIPSIFEGIILLSSDGYMLQDLNGIYLTTKESE